MKMWFFQPTIEVRPDEVFFLSKWQPRVLFMLNLLVIRIVVWGPYPFIALNIGKLWSNNHGRTLQIYLGIKCDATQTYVDQSDNYVMVLTPKELAAVRSGHPDINVEWDNQGGS